MVRVAVLGAGVIGLSCALKIKEKYKDSHVVLISEDFTPNTTGDGSGGLWYPYLCGNTPEHLIAKWGGETYDFLHQLLVEGGHEVRAAPMKCLYRVKKEYRRPEWANNVFAFQQMDEKQLNYLSRIYSADYVYGHTLITLIIPPITLMNYLFQRFKNAAGEVMHAKLTSLQDSILNEFEVVVNCTGMGARELVPDYTVYPIRGQVAKVLAPWILECIVDEDGGNYIIPNAQNCVLGGTHQEHNYNTNVDDKDTEFILKGCQEMVHSLGNAKVLGHWAGLRPGRPEIRLEAENIGGKLVVHNYGHGGSGLTLFWGCATEVLAIIDKHLNKKSKL